MTHSSSKPNKKNQKKYNKRDISGVFLLDKRQGVSSNKVLQEVKHSFQAQKAGHTGALDPMATGLLPICLGDATKFAHFLLDADKGYIATLKIGEKTDTADADGVIIENKDIPILTDVIIQDTLSQFFGKQKQIPPMYSALKKDGKKLYELAREGIEVERQARPIEIKEISLISYTEDTITFSVTCTKGTYIRVLGEDIAHALGTVGHLTMLRRTKTGNFDLADAHSIEELEQVISLDDKDAWLLPTHASVADFAHIQLDETEKQRIQVGQRLNMYEQAKVIFSEHVSETEECLVLMFCDSVFLGMGTLENNGRLQPKRLVAF